MELPPNKALEFKNFGSRYVSKVNHPVYILIKMRVATTIFCVNYIYVAIINNINHNNSTCGLTLR